MSRITPDPKATARAQADVILRAPKQYLERPLERLLADCPYVDGRTLLAGLEAFHAERMAKIPSATKYPEAQPWVEYVLETDKELVALTGMSTLQLATLRSLGAFTTFRGYAQAKPAMVERCRVVYLPDSDQGEFHIKNVDDPLPFWKPTTSAPQSAPKVTGLTWDGVGSGLHIDDEPEEIFPLPYREMTFANCDDVPGAVQFLTRYSPFWGGQNIVLFDAQKRSVAIEKCSHNFIEVFPPDPNGGSHCSGMACRDPQSPQAQYQAKKRLQYLDMFNQPHDNVDMTFWRACDVAERMLGDFMKKPNPTVAEIFELFTTPWPKGLNKTGAKLHPDQACGEYTLVTHAELYDKKQYVRWQRDAFGNYPCIPEVYQF